LATRRTGRAGNGIRDDATHGIIGAASAARPDAEELRRLGLSKARPMAAAAASRCLRFSMKVSR
jgi:hypothetical protein